MRDTLEMAGILLLLGLWIMLIFWDSGNHHNGSNGGGGLL